MCVYKLTTTFQTSVIYSIYTASRDPKYVDDPTSFKPERWMKDSTEDLDAFISLPFGFGPMVIPDNLECCDLGVSCRTSSY